MLWCTEIDKKGYISKSRMYCVQIMYHLKIISNPKALSQLLRMQQLQLMRMQQLQLMRTKRVLREAPRSLASMRDGAISHLAQVQTRQKGKLPIRRREDAAESRSSSTRWKKNVSMRELSKKSSTLNKHHRMQWLQPLRSNSSSLRHLNHLRVSMRER